MCDVGPGRRAAVVRRLTRHIWSSWNARTLTNRLLVQEIVPVSPVAKLLPMSLRSLFPDEVVRNGVGVWGDGGIFGYGVCGDSEMCDAGSEAPSSDGDCGERSYRDDWRENDDGVW